MASVLNIDSGLNLSYKKIIGVKYGLNLKSR